MENGVNNDKNTRFSSLNQPSNEAKSQGWSRKHQKQVFMDKVVDYLDLNLEDFESIREEMKHNKKKFTIQDLIAFEYVSKMTTSDKLLIDWVDRRIGRAKFDTEDQENDDKITKYVVEIVDSNASIQQEQ